MYADINELIKNGYDVLEKNGLAWDSIIMQKADIVNASGQLVMALIVGAIRAERFCDGALLGFLENGCVVKWLERLKQIDDIKRENHE